MAIEQPLSDHTDFVSCLAFASDGSIIASGSADNTIRLWNTENYAIIGEPLTGHTEPVRFLSFPPDNRTIASGSDARTVRLWDAGTGILIGTLVEFVDGVWSLNFNTDSRLLVNEAHVSTASNNPPGLLPASTPDTPLRFEDPWTMVHSKSFIHFRLPSSFQNATRRIHQGKVAYGGQDGSFILVDRTHMM